MSDKIDKEEDKFLIVIGRQFGSGGRRIGKLLADAFGVRYYDKTLLSEAAEQMGLTADVFERNDERRPSLIRSLLSFTYGASNVDVVNGPMSDEKVYELQSKVIRNICARESCVIVGRTADYIMRDHPRMVSIFIHAPIEFRVANTLRKHEAKDEKEAEEMAHKHDHGRESYYNYYTNRDGWGRASNYHLSFDASRISDDAIIATVKDILGI